MIAFFLVLLALVPAGCRLSTGASATPTQTMEGFTLQQTLRGVPLWDLQARTAVLHEDDRAATLSEPRMRFYRDGKLSSTVSAAGGRVQMDTHDVVLSTSVVLDAIDDRSILRTDSLSYSSKRQLFTTDAEVQVERPEGRLRGRGLEAKPDLSEIRIHEQRAVVKGGRA